MLGRRSIIIILRVIAHRGIRDGLFPERSHATNEPRTGAGRRQQPDDGPLWAFSLEKENFRVFMELNIGNTMQRYSVIQPGCPHSNAGSGSSSHSYLGRIRVRCCSSHSNKADEFILKAYDAGIDECIIKPINPSLFHAKVKAWLRRSLSLPLYALDPIRVGNIKLNPVDRRIVFLGGASFQLTTLELRLLYMLMSRSGRPVPAEELIQKVWGYGEEADNTVLKNVIYRLRRKIETNPAEPAIIQTVVGVGYKFVAYL
jgi:DNA-binding winged helix-turn-helix (wHTH) protein